MRRPRRMLLLAVALLLALAGCGGGQQAMTPAEIHMAWIAALRGNDRQAAQTLVASDASLDVDRALEQAQYLVTLDTPQTGRLQAVDVETPVAQGAGEVAISVWRLERLTSCFHTTLAQTDAGWKVTGWDERERDCPPANDGHEAW
jgi:hypothetical protein